MAPPPPPKTLPYLLIAEGGGGPEGGCGAQAAQAPGLLGLGRLQGAPHHSAVGRPMGRGVRECVVGGAHRQPAVLRLAGRSERVGGELGGEGEEEEETGITSTACIEPSNWFVVE